MSSTKQIVFYTIQVRLSLSLSLLVSSSITHICVFKYHTHLQFISWNKIRRTRRRDRRSISRFWFLVSKKMTPSLHFNQIYIYTHTHTHTHTHRETRATTFPIRTLISYPRRRKYPHMKRLRDIFLFKERNFIFDTEQLDKWKESTFG